MVCKKCNVEKEAKDFPRDKNISRGYKSTCKACYSIVDSKRYLKNQDLIKLRASFWYSQNKEQAAESKRLRLKTDINAHLADVLRSRLNKVIKRDCRSSSAVSSLGCSIEKFKVYLESKFKPGMTWDNYGEWHIDHIKPLVLFDLTNVDQLKQACHYTNMQPLWAKENWSKGAKYGS